MALPILEEGEPYPSPAFAVDPDSGKSDELEASDDDSSRMQAQSSPTLAALDGVMPLSFDLARRPASQSTIEVHKSVSFNQQALGLLSVRIDDSSRVYISVLDMSQIFPEQLRPPRSWQEDYVLLSDVRTAGIDLRYDPTADQFYLKDGAGS